MMPLTHPRRTFAFVVPTLNEVAAQNEEVVQLLLFAVDRLTQAVSQNRKGDVAVTILSIEPDLRGWQQLSSLFPKDLLGNITVEALKEPVTPNLAIASHKPAYDLFEHLKNCTFDEVHCLDRSGSVYYATQAKQLGLYCLNTLFAVHIVGGIMFHYAVEDKLLEDVNALMDDLLERGSVERADVIYIHDNKAWAWYVNKIQMRSTDSIYKLTWPHSKAQSSSSIPITIQDANERHSAIIYYGTLSAGGGLPMFCNAIDRLLPTLKQSVEIVFVGSPQAIGGMDAVSYLRLRSAKWGVPVTIKRDFSIAAEIDLLFKLNGIIVCNTARREGLRSRLVVESGLPLLQIKQVVDTSLQYENVCLANPNHIARALSQMLMAKSQERLPSPRMLTDLWRISHPYLHEGENTCPSSPLELRNDGPMVSVCVTHFGRPQLLRTALASLQAQTYRNFEVIVIDDGSSDPEVQRELAKIKQEVQPFGWRLLIQENRYLGAARNYGASEAVGDYLLFMDDDNVAKPNELSTLVAVAVRAGSDIVTSFFDTFESEDALTSGVPSALRLTPFGSDPTLGILTNCYGDANALYSRTIFDKLGGFTEDYGITHEDWEFFCRATLEGAKLVCVPESLFWYRVDQNGMYRGQTTQLHKNANLRRHIRPYLDKLPHYQAQLVQLAQGLTAGLPVVTVGVTTRSAGPKRLQTVQNHLPYGRVAVIMRTKDRPLLLRRAVRSVLDQSFKDWLLVIVNDGGALENVEIVTEEVATELGERLLVLHHPTSLGMQTAANAGISRCDSDFIIIHDDDDSWQPTFLARTVSHLDEQSWNPKVGGVITWAQVIVEELIPDGEIKRHNQFIFNDKLHTISLLELAEENRFPPISFLFHRAAFDTVGAFKEQYSVLGDWEFHLRLLRRYNIDVIQEPLANYHHRTQNTGGIYGNSVHAQNHVHRAKRIELHNDVLRAELTESNGISLAQMMALGDLQKSIIEQQNQEFQRLHDYIWTIEQRVTSIADQIYNATNSKSSRPNHVVFPGLVGNKNVVPAHFVLGEIPKVTSEQHSREFQRLHNDYFCTMEQRIYNIANQVYSASSAKQSRNLIRNGDFRVWPGPEPTIYGPQARYAYSEVCPGITICYDGGHVAYRVERRKYSASTPNLPLGKPYLHIESKGAQGSTWFMMECVIPSITRLAGQTITISGYSRLSSNQNWIGVSGRYELGDGRVVIWPDHFVTLSPDLQRWHCSFTCPAIQENELTRGHHARILLKLPIDQPFEFDLTNLQVELGALPTEFEYNGTRTFRERFFTFWRKMKVRVKSLVVSATDVNTLSNPENAL